MKCQRRMLRISWRQFVRNSEISALTGLPAINDIIRHRCIAVFGHIARLQDSTPSLKRYSLTLTSHSVVFPIPPGVVGLVTYVAHKSTKSETTPARHLPTSGDRPLDAVIMDERRDGPRWLCDLHWLRVGQRVEFKLAVLVYRCLNGQGPPYLASDLHRVADLDTRRRLRSSSSGALTVPLTRLSTVGDRVFPVAAARVWNGLPSSVTSSPSLATFKTELFARSFPVR